jgi:hypothetical protein
VAVFGFEPLKARSQNILLVDMQITYMWTYFVNTKIFSGIWKLGFMSFGKIQDYIKKTNDIKKIANFYT